MIGFMTKVVLATALAAQCVSGHAVLKSPAPFNIPATRRGPCGINLANSNAVDAYALAVKPGSIVEGVWEQEANDGAGRVTQTLIASGNPNDIAAGGPTIQNGMNIPNGNALYPFKFQVPETQAECQGKVGDQNNVCLYQFRSTSNWYSCTYVALLDDPPPPPQPTCEVLTGLTTCSALNNKRGVIPIAQTPASVEAGVKQLIEADTPMSADVFNAGTRATCSQPLVDYLCASAFPLCEDLAAYPAVPTATVCKTRCENMAAGCVVDPDHAGLYDCNTRTEDNADIMGPCPARLNVPATRAAPQAMTVQPGGTPSGWSVPTTLNKYQEMAVFAGDLLEFQNSGGHNVYKFHDKAAYDACNFQRATLLAASTTNKYTYHVDINQGTLFFGCQVPGHCLSGQKVMATVHAGGTCTAGINQQCNEQYRVGCGAIGGNGVWSDCGACMTGYSEVGGKCEQNAVTPTDTGSGSGSSTGSSGSGTSGSGTSGSGTSGSGTSGSGTSGSGSGSGNQNFGPGDSTGNGNGAASTATVSVVGAVASVVMAMVL